MSGPVRRLVANIGYLAVRPAIPIAVRTIAGESSLPSARRSELVDERLRAIVAHAAACVPFYRDMFRRLGADPRDIQTVADLDALPVVTKADIRASPEAFLAEGSYKWVAGSTGGSTGTPLRFRMSVDCYARGAALLIRGRSLAGYELGDRLLTVGGGSLARPRQSFRSRIQDLVANVRHVSSYGMDSDKLFAIVELMSRWQPLYLRGYSSSLYVLSRHMQVHGLQPPRGLRAIFSTAEMLLPSQRRAIEDAFGVKVFNHYGLNDGGASAFECAAHDGLHVDTERAVVQVVDEAGRSLTGQSGRIVATSLFNRAMPFIRYDTGDAGVLSYDPCSCGIRRPRLIELLGRTTDYLKLNDYIIGSPQLTVLFGKFDLDYYQILQTAAAGLRISYVPGRTFGESEMAAITASFESHVGSLSIDWNRLALPPDMSDRKHKFIINEVCP